MIFETNICASCAHLKFDPDRMIMNCAAFPEGAPLEILDGSFDHRDPHPGDGGITWAFKPGKQKELFEYEEMRQREFG